MTVYLLFDVNLAYGDEKLVGVFSEERFAKEYAKVHSIKRTVTRCAGCDLTNVVTITYKIKPYEVDSSVGDYGGVYGNN